MIKQNFDHLIEQAEKKGRQREKKKKKMAVSGAGVKKLQKIISNK